MRNTIVSLILALIAVVCFAQAQVPPGNPVVFWMQTLNQAVIDDKMLFAYAARNNLYLYNGLYLTLKKLGCYKKNPKSTCNDRLVSLAISHSAQYTLKTLHPQYSFRFEGYLRLWIRAETDKALVKKARFYGESGAMEAMKFNGQDGWGGYVDSNNPYSEGKARPTFPAYAPLVLDFCSNISLVALKGPAFEKDLVISNYPSLTSQRFVDSVEEVKRVGGKNSTVRTAYQTQSAPYWAGEPGTSTNVGPFAKVLADIVTRKNISIKDTVILYKLLGIANYEHNAVVNYWKFSLYPIRPITVIREGLPTINPSIATIPNFESLLTTPANPEYPCGHCTVSSCIARVLALAFGQDDITQILHGVSGAADGAQACSDPNTVPIGSICRKYKRFYDMGIEAAESRIYAGVHFRFSKDMSVVLGTRMGDTIFNTMCPNRSCFNGHVMSEDYVHYTIPGPYFDEFGNPVDHEPNHYSDSSDSDSDNDNHHH